jgi:hypothetical protein
MDVLAGHCFPAAFNRRAFALFKASEAKWARFADSARRRRSGSGKRRSGSTWLRNLSSNARRAGAVRFAGSLVAAHDEWAAP